MKASRRVSLAGFAVHSQPSVLWCTDIMLRDISTDGTWHIFIYEASQVWIVSATVNVAYGYAAIAVYDKSDVHIVGRLADTARRTAPGTPALL